jgi:hypothetical protein
MSRRGVVAAGLVALALTVGIIRTVTDSSGTAAPPTNTASAHPAWGNSPARPSNGPASATAAPTANASSRPAISLPPPAASASPGKAATTEPVDEGAGDPDGSALAGRDTGPDESAADATGGRIWEPVAAGFGRAFTTVGTRDTTATWRARLRPYVTAAVDKQLATVDVGNVPEGRLDGLDLLEGSDEQVTVQATYTPGWALVLYLISDGTDEWKVYRYDRLEQ